jgi:hypothetical protein
MIPLALLLQRRRVAPRVPLIVMLVALLRWTPLLLRAANRTTGDRPTGISNRPHGLGRVPHQVEWIPW